MITRAAARMATMPTVAGVSGGSLLVVLAAHASPLPAAAAMCGLAVVGGIVAFPYAGFLLTAFVVPLERIGRFTNDSSLATVSLMRIVGTLTLAALLVHILLRRRRVLISAPGLLYILYFGVGVLTLACTSDFEFGVRAASAMLGNLLFFLLVINIVRTPQQARAAVVCWLLSTVAIGAFTIYQWHNPAAIITEDRFNSTGQRSSDQRFSTVLADASEYQSLDQTPRALGTTSHPAVYAINLILTLPFFAYFFRTTRGTALRAAIVVAAAITCYNVVLANTRAALITMVLVLGLILVTGLVRVTAGLLATIVAGALIALPFAPGAIWNRVLDVSNYTVQRSDTLRARLIYWDEGLSMVSENWLFGIGLGNQTDLPRRLNDRMYMPPNSTVHNEYLQSLLETGLLGYPLLVAFMTVLYRRAKQGERSLARAGRTDPALLLRAGRVALLAVLIYGTQVDVLHFPLKGWWLAMGLVVAITERWAASNREAERLEGAA
jgi:O-antigen ligase/polysaccharide polymerase Wzy-like membrane protein